MTWILIVPMVFALIQDTGSVATPPTAASDEVPAADSGASRATPTSTTIPDPKPSVASTPTPTPIPISTFKEPTTPPPVFESEHDYPPGQGPKSNLPLYFGIIAGAAVLGYGLYRKMNGGSMAENQKEDRKEKCNYLKATMDSKMRELADLEGKAKGKIKEAAKNNLKDALLSEEEKKILGKIERAKSEYEKLKALYEECIVDAGRGKTKTLKFRSFKADMILKGEKTSSLRLFDDKDLEEGDEPELINWETKKMFDKAKIEEIKKKKLSEIGEEDLLGHESFKDGIVEALKRYYGDKVSPETTGKIVRFKLKK